MMRLLELLSSRTALAVLLPALALAAWSALAPQPWFTLGAQAAFGIAFCGVFAGVVLPKSRSTPKV